MPKANERSQCAEIVQDARIRLQDEIIDSYRAFRARVDLTLPGMKDIIRWLNNTRVRRNTLINTIFLDLIRPLRS